MTRLLIDIDTNLCNGYGNCVVAAPDVFDIDPDTNLAFLLEEDVSEEHRASVEEAVADCPVHALRVRSA